MRRGKPSRTAYKVALDLVTLGAKPEMEAVLPAGIVDATARLLIASGAASPAVVRWAASPKMIAVYEAFDWMLPGQFEAFGHRKAFCEGQVREGIAAGATQILVLGAGYDTLGWRLAPEFPGVTFFEIDHPATAALKARGISSMGGRDNLRLIAEDLGQRTLAAVLQGNAPWDAGAQTVIVAEGLVMYLLPDAVKEMFRQCAALTGTGSRIAFTYLPAGAGGRPDVGQWPGLMLWLQNALGEPWLWGIGPADLAAFLAPRGWAPTRDAPHGRYGVEFFCAATRTHNPIKNQA